MPRVYKQLQQPKTLQELAKYRIVEWITSHVEVNEDVFSYVPELDTKETEELNRKIKTLRDYFECLPGVFAKDMFVKLKYHILMMPHMVFYSQRLEEQCNLLPPERLCATARWIEVLFTKYVDYLYLTAQTTNIFKTSLSTQTYLLTGLTELHIYEFLVPDSDEERIKCADYTEIFKRIPNLKHINLDCRTDKFLRCVIDNCKSLVTVDLYVHYNIRLDTLNDLIKLPNIETVNLYDSFEEYLFYLTDQEVKKKELWKYIILHKQFQMKYLIISNGITDEDLEITKKYPMIERVEYVDTIGEYVSRNLSNLKHLEGVRELKVYGCNFYKHQVVELLQILGKNLENLQLSHVNRIDIQALLTICVLCPKLQVLTLRLTSFYPSERKPRILKYKALLRDVPRENKLFYNLHTFNLTVGMDEDEYLNTSVPQPILNQFITAHLIQIFPNIEHLDLTLDYSDDFMLKVLKLNPLKKLKKLRVVNHTRDYIRKLDERVIDHIKKNCTLAEVVISTDAENFIY